jgi:acetylornithine deacetylase/succinyl-diaminopimelate desuccinylase-like protein
MRGARVSWCALAIAYLAALACMTASVQAAAPGPLPPEDLDGGGGDYKNGERLNFKLGTSEKNYVTYTLETTSPGGHGSLPGPDNAIYRLADGLGRLENYHFPVVLTATTRANFAKVADLNPGADSPDMKVTAVVDSMWPHVPVVPTMATGFSDDRQTRNAGMPSYDLSGIWIDVDENRAHGRDERVGVREFDESIEYTYRLMKAMSGAR